MSYEQFAYYYDSLMDPKFYEDYYQFIIEHAKFHDVLELGCGTGEIAIRLAKEDFNVYATDLSQDMLNVTKEKAIENDVNLRIQRVDMTDFLLTQPIDLILCLCDSINYVTDLKKIKTVFKNTYKSLKKTGTFIFDVNSLYKNNVILNKYKEEENEDDFYFLWEVDSDQKGSVKHKVIIEDKEEHQRVEETHYQKTFSTHIYKGLLEEIGFKNVEIYSDFKEYNEECERVIFVCKKGELK